MNFLFPTIPYTKVIHPDFQVEYNTAKLLGYNVYLFDDEDMKVYIPLIEGEIIYRGWMMKPDQYQILYDTVKKGGCVLINNTIEYTTCHHFPEVYKYIKDFTPKYSLEFNDIKNLGSEFIIKTPTNLNFIKDLIKDIPSNFYTIDIAEKEDGSWTILETGDGGVSGLAVNANIMSFYNSFYQ
jgi:hypothetical protein